MPVLTLRDEQILRLRASAQGLCAPAGVSPRAPAEVLASCCGVQAQDAPAGALGVRARSPGGGLTAQSVDRAQKVERSTVRGWFMRGTLHLIAAEDARWLIPFFGPILVQWQSRRLAQVGWDAEAAPAGLKLVRDAVTERGPLTRDTIARLLEVHHLPYAGQATIHLIYRAVAEGTLCQGPDQGKRPSFALRKDWLGPLQPLPFETALDRLIMRYLAAFGPAGPEDMAAWSGLKISLVRAAWERIAPNLVEVHSPSGRLWALPEQIAGLDALPAQTCVRLLPRWDNCLLAYRSRDRFVDPAFASRITPGGGMFEPTLQVDGRIQGVWKPTAKRGGLEITVDPFEPLDSAIWDGINAEIQDIRRFLGMGVQ